MTKKIKKVREAWEFLGEVLETFHNYDLPNGAVLEEGLCHLLHTDAWEMHDTGIIRQILDSRVDSRTIRAMYEQLLDITDLWWEFPEANVRDLGEWGGDLHNRALFCYFMANKPKR